MRYRNTNGSINKIISDRVSGNNLNLPTSIKYSNKKAIAIDTKYSEMLIKVTSLPINFLIG